jgi:hypothetical protein
MILDYVRIYHSTASIASIRPRLSSPIYLVRVFGDIRDDVIRQFLAPPSGYRDNMSRCFTTMILDFTYRLAGQLDSVR